MRISAKIPGKITLWVKWVIISASENFAGVPFDARIARGTSRANLVVLHFLAQCPTTMMSKSSRPPTPAPPPPSPCRRVTSARAVSW